ncbi:MAG: hypothetical protein AABX85_03530 [Nanoarchaeota archaeon]
MAVNIHNLIAAINPEVYCEPNIEEEGKWINLRDRVKKIVKEKGYLVAAETAQVVEPKAMDLGEIGLPGSVENVNPFKLPGIKNPIEKHLLVYDSTSQNLEPIYFWILDNLYQEYKSMKQVDKLVDNFISSPGSGHFSETGQKATKMQDEAMKLIGVANQVVKSILNLIYDLKEFRIRLDLYDKYKSNKPEEKESAFLSLKQIWMDTVDMKRGNTSIKALALGSQSYFVTLIDAFMKTKTLKEIDEIDLNDRVKRLLQQRLGEFLNWILESEKELRKRYEIERTYLKSQVNTVHLYARWAKPYLRAARKLEQNAADTAALVTAFNTVLFELTLLGQSEYRPEDDVARGDLPKEFKKAKLRKYQPLIIVELKFRSIPERAGQQGYGFRGRVEITFTSYALNKDEVQLLKELIAQDDFGDVFKFIQGATEESLGQLKEDIDFFLKDLDEKPGKKDESNNNSNDTNPFSALFSAFKKSESSDEKKSEQKEGDILFKEIKKDSDYEKVVRSMAIITARQECRKFYNLYKKVHEMPTF